jgi:O-antigen ligase
MKNIIIVKNNIKKKLLQLKIGVILTLSIIIFFLSYVIKEEKWIYTGILLIPFFIYFSIKKPFIFPFGAYVFLLPFDSVVAITGSKGTTLTKLLGIMTILVLLLKGSFEKRFKKLDKAAIHWILFIVYSLLSIFWANDPNVVKSRYLTAIGLLFLYIIVSSYKVQREDYNIVKYCILAGGFCAAIITIYEFIVFGNIVYGTKDFVRTSLTIGDRISEINRFAFNLLLPLSVCIQMLLFQKRRPWKILLISILGIITICIILSGSRGNLISAGVIFIVYILFSKKNLTIWTIVLCIGIIFVSLAQNFFFPRWEQAIETGGSGRTAIWSAGVSALKKYWILGAGLDNFMNVYSEFGRFTPFSLNIYRPPHNIYLGVLIELGIIGFLLLIWVIIKHYKIILSYLHYDKNAIMLKAAFWSVIVSSFFLDTLWIKSFWLLWILILMYKNVVEEEKLKYNLSFLKNRE